MVGMRRRVSGISRVRSAWVIVLVLSMSAPAMARIWHVDQEGCPRDGDGSEGSPFCSIQEAMVVSVNGDEIIVRPGTYVENVDCLGKSLTLRGVDPLDWDVVEATIIDGNGTGVAITCSGTRNAPVTPVISGLTITGGVGDDAGGVTARVASLTLSYCHVRGNRGFFGGGVRVTAPSDGAVLIDHCRITENVGDWVGGFSISASRGGQVIVQDCDVARNRAVLPNAPVGAGGGFLTQGSHTVRNCTFDSNTIVEGVREEEEAGGLLMWAVPNLVEGCSFRRNAPSGVWFVSVGNLADSYFCENLEIDFGGNINEETGNLARFRCDCNNNGIDDDDIENEEGPDCNENMVPDSCDAAEGGDCNQNGIPDSCDIADGTSFDVDPADGIPDECQWNGACCIQGGCVMMFSTDCQANGGRPGGPRSTCADDPYCGPPIVADVDEDGDVDLEDFGILQKNLTGPR